MMIMKRKSNSVLTALWKWIVSKKVVSWFVVSVLCGIALRTVLLVAPPPPPPPSSSSSPKEQQRMVVVARQLPNIINNNDNNSDNDNTYDSSYDNTYDISKDSSTKHDDNDSSTKHEDNETNTNVNDTTTMDQKSSSSSNDNSSNSSITSEAIHPTISNNNTNTTNSSIPESNSSIPESNSSTTSRDDMDPLPNNDYNNDNNNSDVTTNNDNNNTTDNNYNKSSNSNTSTTSDVIQPLPKNNNNTNDTNNNNSSSSNTSDAIQPLPTKNSKLSSNSDDNTNNSSSSRISESNSSTTPGETIDPLPKNTTTNDSSSGGSAYDIRDPLPKNNSNNNNSDITIDAMEPLPSKSSSNSTSGTIPPIPNTNNSTTTKNGNISTSDVIQPLPTQKNNSNSSGISDAVKKPLPPTKEENINDRSSNSTFKTTIPSSLPKSSTSTTTSTTTTTTGGSKQLSQKKKKKNSNSTTTKNNYSSGSSGATNSLAQKKKKTVSRSNSSAASKAIHSLPTTTTKEEDNTTTTNNNNTILNKEEEEKNVGNTTTTTIRKDEPEEEKKDMKDIRNGGTTNNSDTQPKQEEEEETFVVVDNHENLLLSQVLLQKFNIRNSSASEIVYLHHCDLNQVNVAAFLEWQSLLFTQLVVDTNSVPQDYEEVTLQALEMFAVASNVCNFSNYNFSIPQQQQQHNRLLEQKIARIPLPANRSDQARLVFLISASPSSPTTTNTNTTTDDYPHLEQLIKLLHLPHHLIILHLDKQAPVNYRNQVQALADSFPNVVLLQFGVIIHPTDTLTQIFLQIFRWVTMDLKFDYDYLVTADASSFPLWTASEMAHKLATEPRRVRIGRMYARSHRKSCDRLTDSHGLVRGTTQILRTSRKPLIEMAKARNSSANHGSIFANQLSAFGLPKRLQWQCKRKMVSGNTAAFDVDAVRALLTNPDAMRVMTYFKFHGHCCADQFNWGTALDLIGRYHDLDKPENSHGAMWQYWPCKSSSSTMMMSYDDPNVCISISLGTRAYEVRGIEAVKQELFLARTERGNLMGRKFGSSNTDWKEWIQSNLYHVEEKYGSNVTWHDLIQQNLSAIAKK